jgi:hypothetical protein
MLRHSPSFTLAVGSRRAAEQAGGVHHYNACRRALLYSRGWFFQQQHVFLAVMFMDGP